MVEIAGVEKISPARTSERDPASTAAVVIRIPTVGMMETTADPTIAPTVGITWARLLPMPRTWVGKDSPM